MRLLFGREGLTRRSTLPLTNLRTLLKLPINRRIYRILNIRQIRRHLLPLLGLLFLLLHLRQFLLCRQQLLFGEFHVGVVSQASENLPALWVLFVEL